MRLWAALALAAAAATAKKTESSQQDTKYEIDKLQALVDNKKTRFDSLEATLRRASESDGAAAEDAKPDADSDAVVDISSDKPGGEKKKKKKKDADADAAEAAPAAEPAPAPAPAPETDKPSKEPTKKPVEEPTQKPTRAPTPKPVSPPPTSTPVAAIGEQDEPAPAWASASAPPRASSSVLWRACPSRARERARARAPPGPPPPRPRPRPSSSSFSSPRRPACPTRCPRRRRSPRPAWLPRRRRRRIRSLYGAWPRGCRTGSSCCQRAPGACRFRISCPGCPGFLLFWRRRPPPAPARPKISYQYICCQLQTFN